MKKVFASLPLLFLLLGCANVASPVTSIRSQTNQVSNKNYTLGQDAIVYVGEPLVSVKKYVVLESESSLRASNPFTIKGGLLDVAVNLSGSQEQEFPIVGSLNVSGVSCRAIKIPGSTLVFGIKPNGSFSGVAGSFDYMTSPIKGVNIYEINPPDTRFYPIKTQHVLESAPFTNMELIYSGLSDDALRLLYREYTPKDLIRPAFGQELSYPPDAKTIRFRNYKIEIKEASAEKLVYCVIED